MIDTRPVALMLTLALLSACEYRAVVGQRELDDDFGDEETGVSDGDFPLLDVGSTICEPPPTVGCDGLDDDPLHAVELDCVGGIPVAGGITANDEAWSVFEGQLGPYPAREGEKFLILSTGKAAQLAMTHEALAMQGLCEDAEFCPNTDWGQELDGLPPPIDVDPVDPADPTHTCGDDPNLVGLGDCSNSLSEQWDMCGMNCAAWDYAELRIGLTVPESTRGLAFDFAFMSVEWPEFAGAGFNDMFIAWLESERWTGNISFDGEGNPITVNAGFLDYQGDDLEGFAMAGHGGTTWLTTDVGLVPGENIVLVLAVLDLGDGSYDSAVLLDKFRWTCSDAPPNTQPVP